MATTMTSSDSAIRAIQEMLQQKCIEEPAFALRMASPSKSMEGTINYLCQQVQKSGLTCLDNQSVASILYHYFDEANIEEVKNVNCNIVVSKPELSDEDKAELREQAMREYKEEQLRAIRRENQPKPQAKASANNAKAQEINVEPTHFPFHQCTNFNPIIEIIKVVMKKRRQKVAGSSKNRIPTITVPTAPIPVHTG